MTVYVAGHRGMVGSALVRRLQRDGVAVGHPSDGRGPDLRDREQTERIFNTLRPDEVYLAAARVGGIGANSSLPVDHLLDNLRISCNVIEAAHRHPHVRKLVNLGSSCIYPREAPQPMPEECLLTGPLEPTNEPYALAKIAALKLVQAYRQQHGDHFVSVMPTNLYGPSDRYDVENSHVLPTLIMKFEHARLHGGTVTLWGSGRPLREFLYVDDLADALVLVMREYDDDLWLNIGSDDELSIADLADVVARQVGYDGPIRWDSSRPDGTPRKKLDCSRIHALGWRPQVSLEEGIGRTIEDYRSRHG